MGKMGCLNGGGGVFATSHHGGGADAPKILWLLLSLQGPGKKREEGRLYPLYTTNKLEGEERPLSFFVDQKKREEKGRERSRVSLTPERKKTTKKRPGRSYAY